MAHAADRSIVRQPFKPSKRKRLSDVDHARNGVFGTPMNIPHAPEALFLRLYPDMG
jgi:hypothetical protein